MSRAESKIPEEFLTICREKFGASLKCVLLYGSRAKEEASKHSDWDFLVVTEGLPAKRSDRSKIFKEIRLQFVKEFKQSLQVVPLTPSELFEGPISPLIYGILTGYKLVYGQKFWDRYLDSIRPEIEERDPIYMEGDKEWRIAKVI